MTDIFNGLTIWVVIGSFSLASLAASEWFDAFVGEHLPSRRAQGILYCCLLLLSGPLCWSFFLYFTCKDDLQMYRCEQAQYERECQAIKRDLAKRRLRKK